jgi:hypothetical protein
MATSLEEAASAAPEMTEADHTALLHVGNEKDRGGAKNSSDNAVVVR